MTTLKNMDRDVVLELMDNANAQDGDVAAPGGYFCLIEVTEEVAAELAQTHTSIPDTGWYLSAQNEQGQVNVWLAESEEAALEIFNAQTDYYHAWLDSVSN